MVEVVVVVGMVAAVVAGAVVVETKKRISTKPDTMKKGKFTMKIWAENRERGQ